MKQRKSTWQKRQNLRGTLRCEPLETRYLLAGDVCFPLQSIAAENGVAPSAEMAGGGQQKVGQRAENFRKAEASHRYWADGREVPLGVHPQRVAIGFESGHAGQLGEAAEDLQQVRPVSGDVAIYESATLTAEELTALAAESVGVSLVSPVFVIQETQTEAVVLDEVIVALRPGVDPDRFFENERFAGYRPLRGTPDQFVATVATGVGEAALQVANEVSADRRVAWASPNFYQDWQRFYTPDDPRFGNLWHLENTGQGGGLAGADQNLLEAWDVIQGGSSEITIGVYDDGVVLDHPDLNIWVNQVESSGGPGTDDDNNGWIDDFHGWDVINGDNGVAPTDSINHHGTAVAGVAAAIGDNGIGVAGASYGSPVIVGKMFEGRTAGSEAEITEGLYYLAGRTADGSGSWDAADLVNNSWGGGGPSSAFSAALTWATTEGRGGLGVPYLFSAGNGGVGVVSYPAAYAATIPGVIAIGAHSNFGVRSSYSQYGEALDIVTASNGGSLAIDTTDRLGAAGYSGSDYTGTGGSGFGGTSSAAPLASGVTGLLMAEALNQEIDLTAPQIRELLRVNTRLMSGGGYDPLTGKNWEYGFGALDAGSLLRGVGNAEISVISSATDLVSGSDTVDFPVTPTGDFSELVLRIRNQGTSTLEVTDASIPSGPFTIAEGPADTSLEAGEATTITVRFSPTSVGSETSDLTIASTDADEASFVIGLVGEAVPTSIGGIVFEDGDADAAREANEAAVDDALVYLDANDNDLFDLETNTYSENDPVDINDFDTAVSTLMVSGPTDPLYDVNVELNITHTYVSDLTAELVAPDGTRVRLFTEVGFNGDNFTGTVLDDDATTPIANGSAPFTGTFRPQDPLAGFQGIDANGEWVLEVTDNYGADIGTIDSWSLEIATSEIFDTPNPEGRYGFVALDPGEYTVRVAETGTYSGLTPAGGEYTITIADAGDSWIDNHFGVGVNDRFYAHVFEDSNGDGVVDEGELPLAGRSIFLDANGDGIYQRREEFADTASGPLPIPNPADDTQPVLSTIEVAGFAGSIADVDVRVNINHAWNSDLDVYLIAPDGTRVELFTAVGGDSDDFIDTVLDDQAALSINDGSAPYTGTFRPEGMLGDLDGFDPNGVWTLEIMDTYPSLDDGVFNEWELIIRSPGEVGTESDAYGDVVIDLPAGTHAMTLEEIPDWNYTVPVDGVHSETPAGAPLAARLFGTRPAELLVGVAEVELNGGEVQRSMTTELKVTFDGEVNVADGAFSVQDTDTGETAEVNVETQLVGDVTIALLTFVGGDALETNSSSLRDGNYLLTIDAALVSDLGGNQIDGDGDGTAGGNFLFGDDEADAFFRFFGDVDADRTVGFGDFLVFRNAYGKSEPDADYNDDVDFDQDGDVDFGDFLGFRSRYGESLPF